MIIGQKRTEKEYRKLDVLSSTDLRTFATKGRKGFYQRVILKQKSDEEDSRATIIGKAGHCLLLEPHEFDSKFYMSVCNKEPTGNMKEFVNSLYKHTVLNADEEGKLTKDFEEIAQEAYKESGYTGWTLKKVLTEFTGKSPEMYYRDLRESKIKGKTLICSEDRSIADRVVETIKTHDFTRNMFHGEKEVQIEGFNINNLELKAMLDDVEVYSDYVIGTDLKIVWDNENFYNEYFLKKRADIQAYIYVLALKHKYPDKEIKFRFVAADSQNFNAPLIYHINSKILDNAYWGFKEGNREYPGVRQIIEEIIWHMDTQNWTMSKQAFDNAGIIKL